MSVQRTRGVAATIVFLIIVAELGIIAAYWAETYFIPEHYQNIYLSLSLVSLLHLSLEPGGNFWAIFLWNQANTPSITNIYLAVLAIRIFSGLCFIDAVGLYYMKKWAIILLPVLLFFLMLFLQIIV